ncbi:MAG TPA: PQQ-dependent sugar dehydrogenase, partial [Bryobacteraceae bacterium]|nr:PQQ-dependent sugar dehydrogenase [Bryobacteraceae bacterium]
MIFRLFAIAAFTLPAFAADHQLTIQLRDLYTVPITGAPNGRTQDTANLARVNFLREEPGPSRNRFFVNDQNGPLYILDRKTGKFSVYLDFNGRGDRKGIYHRFTNNVGYASGLICFQFDPAYRRNGRFYTLHMENPDSSASPNPDNATVPGLAADDYAVTDAVHTPGNTTREVVLVEWTDTNTDDAVFQGTAREILRFQLNTQIHPVGDMIFNPTARPGDPDWRVMYIGCGDSGSGESKDLSMRYNPQRLDTLLGKILRIIPDPAEHKDTSKLSDNGRYRVPNDNPFASRAGARPEIWAYGIRNPHRLSWDVDPANAKNNHLFASVIGLHTWETVLLVQKGANYGYSEREGN